jgi:V8-like Glu-specific endopeptidase
MRMRTLFCAIGLTLLLTSFASAQVHQEAIIKPVAVDISGPFTDRGDGVVWSQELREPGSLYMRVFFNQISSPANAQYTLVVRNGEDRIIERFSATEFAQSSEFQTGVLFTDTVRLELKSSTPPVGLVFRLDRYLYQVDLQGRINALSLVPTWRSVLDVSGVPEPVPALVSRSQEAVAKLYIGSGVVCTSFLVTPSAVLTNFHCLAESTEYQRTSQGASPGCSDIEAHFEYNRQPAPDAVVKSRCQRIIASDKKLDIALLQIDPNAVSPGQTIRRPLSLARSFAPGEQGQEVIIIHHPGGLAKQFTFACRAFSVSLDIIEHDCSTIPGSSGAAVISRDGAVVAVHYAGPFDESMTVGEINAAVRRGRVFRNKARPSPAVFNFLGRFLP